MQQVEFHVHFPNRLFELPDPSWTELHYFVQFLNTQLMACEHSVYCDEAVVSDISQGVYGFKSFVVKFMIRMAVVSIGVHVWRCLLVTWVVYAMEESLEI